MDPVPSDWGPHGHEALVSSGGAGRLSCSPCPAAPTFSAIFGFRACHSVKPLPPLCVLRFSKEETE